MVALASQNADGQMRADPDPRRMWRGRSGGGEVVVRASARLEPAGCETGCLIGTVVVVVCARWTLVERPRAKSIAVFFFFFVSEKDWRYKR
jgi:hypothetical protein